MSKRTKDLEDLIKINPEHETQRGSERQRAEQNLNTYLHNLGFPSATSVHLMENQQIVLEWHGWKGSVALNITVFAILNDLPDNANPSQIIQALSGHDQTIKTAIRQALSEIKTNHPEADMDQLPEWVESDAQQAEKEKATAQPQSSTSVARKIWLDVKSRFNTDTGIKAKDKQAQASPVRPESQNPVKNMITLNIDGEDVEVDPTITITWADILAQRLKETVAIPEPVSETVPTQFPIFVLADLRDDIQRMRREGKTNRKIYLDLAVRYHSDLYQQATQEVRELADRYFKALQALKENKEL